MGESLAVAYSDLVAEWHPTKNGNNTPENTSRGADFNAWWRCAKGHEWQARVYNRTKKRGRPTGCPVCCPVGVRKLLPGVNDLATLRPDVAVDWHPTKNTLKPSDVPKASRKKVWWLCSFCGREWEAVIKNRTSRNTGCPSCRGRKRGIQVSGNSFPPNLVAEWSSENEHAITDYSIHSSFIAKWVCEKGHKWDAQIAWRSGPSQAGCRRCAMNGTSQAEQEVFAFVQSLIPDAKLHDRSIAPNYEYDIAVPSRKIAIEYNGLYWHSEEFKPRNYHKDKSEAARKQGWQVITIWEDDWLYRQDVVEKMLAHKLGVSSQTKHNARELTVNEVPVSVAKTFLNENHIQGAAGGSIRLGLYTKDSSPVLVAVMLFKVRSKQDKTYELVRYATSGIVRGGFSKLFKHFLRANPGVQQVASFSDYAVSDGSLYVDNGFVQSGELEPDYMYVVNGRREHKFNYRKKRFRDDPELIWDATKTEKELARINKISRVYDSGKIRWTYVW